MTAVAAKLFASEPFHKVRLDDVAAAAGVGKGTLYVYFNSKEDLYLSIIYDGFSEMIDRLKGPLADNSTSAVERIRIVVRELAKFAFQHPQLFELMRAQGGCHEPDEGDSKRHELGALVEQTLRDGIARGEICDPHPELTAAYIPTMVRAAIVFGPKDLIETKLVEHVISTIENGICKPRT